MITQINHVKNTQFPFTKFHSLFRFLCSNANSLYQSNSKITKFFKNGDIKAALNVFDKMPIKNIVTWNCVISGYIKNGMVFHARKVFDEMPVRNVVSWTAMLNGYAKCGKLKESRSLFDAMVDKNVVCWNAMLSGYVKNARFDEARKLFDEIPMKNSVSWATMIEGCFGQGRVEEAMELYKHKACPFDDLLVNNAVLAGYAEMGDLESLWHMFVGMRKVDVASWTTVISCCMKCGKMVMARELFDGMPRKDVIAWTVMIQGYVENDQIEDARKLFDEMPNRDIVAWNSIMGGYVKSRNLEEAVRLFETMPKRDVVSWNTILQGYVQEHDVVKARIFFNKIPVKDRTTWNIMICGHQSDEALDFYAKMLQNGIKPDQVTFTGLISVCGSLAVISLGKAMHSCVIKLAYVNISTVVSSLISMYSKCGFMDDADLIFQTAIKKGMKKDTVLWNAMIVAHSHHGSISKALKLFSSMTESGCQPDHLTFLGLLTGCAHSGMVKESLEYFESMEKTWKIHPAAEHYACMIDVLGRRGMLTEAYELVKRLPLELPSYTWETLLSCCRVHENFELGELVAQKLYGRLDAGICVLRSNIYAARGMWADAADVRTSLARRGVKKELACSWIELNGRVFRFVCKDRSRSHTQMELQKMLESLSAAMEIYG